MPLGVEFGKFCRCSDPALSNAIKIYVDVHRKKTHTWYGTVAGTLSSGCPAYFNSGAQELRESGWWKLAENKPPPIEISTFWGFGTMLKSVRLFLIFNTSDMT